MSGSPEQGNMDTIWYAFKNSTYQGSAPWYYDPKDFDWTTEIEKNIDTLRSELFKVIEKREDQFVPYFNTELTDGNSSWKTLIFYFWSIRNNDVMNRFPALEKIFDAIPGFVSAAISKLEAGSEINWHHGDTNGVIRCHLPLVVPSGLPDCGFEVGEEQRSWEEGKFLMFCDAHRHRAFNRTNNDRLLLIIDVMHPDYYARRNSVIRNVLSILWLQQIRLKWPFLGKSPQFVQGMLRRLCLVFSYFYLPLKRRRNTN